MDDQVAVQRAVRREVGGVEALHLGLAGPMEGELRLHVLAAPPGEPVIVIVHPQEGGHLRIEGQRLADVADVTIDTCVPRGDALVAIPGVEFPVGGVSSVVGLAIINAVVVETTHQLQQRGVNPPVIPTMNLPGGDEKMEELVRAYRERLPLLHNA